MKNFLKAATFSLMLYLGGSDGPYFPYVNFIGVVVFGGILLGLIQGDKPHGTRRL
jgi:hypothetical protein